MAGPSVSTKPLSVAEVVEAVVASVEVAAEDTLVVEATPVAVGDTLAVVGTTVVEEAMVSSPSR